MRRHCLGLFLLLSMSVVSCTWSGSSYLSSGSSSIAASVNTPATILLQSYVSDANSFTIVEPPAHGNLSGTAPNLIYTPTNNYVGTDSFVFRASSSNQTSVPQTIQISIADPLEVLHVFTGYLPYGATATGPLAQSGNYVYGMASQGGESNVGTIFRFSTVDNTWTNLHSFVSATDGSNPTGGLIIDGNDLYGMTSTGGSDSYGTIFTLKIDGTGFTVLYTFKNGAMGGTDGGNPGGNLLLSAGYLYGMENIGGVAGSGSIFKLPVGGGTGFQTLYSFPDISNASSGTSGLTLAAGKLFGTEPSDGTYGQGSVFSLNLDGTGFQTVHSFDGSNGSAPTSRLILGGGLLYGVSYAGGSTNAGTIYSIDPINGTFNLLYDFTTGAYSADPVGDLVYDSNTLYGVTAQGGLNLIGNIFSLPASGGSYTSLRDLYSRADGENPVGGLVMNHGKLFGLTAVGSTGVNGEVFRINPGGTGFQNYDFPPGDGTTPQGDLIISSGTIYGMGVGGGANNVGASYRMATDGSQFQTILANNSVNGQYGRNFALVGTTLFGLTQYGGGGGAGTIFSLQTDGSHLQDLHDFSYATGGTPVFANLSIIGSRMFGVTLVGGAHGGGTLFRMDFSISGTTVTASNYTVLHDFVGGSYPTGLLANDETYFYGMTDGGGVSSNGVIYRIRMDESGSDGTYTVLHDFTGADGSGPYGSLTLSGTTLYGGTTAGGDNAAGVIFSMDKGDPSSYRVIHSFNSAPGDGATFCGALVAVGDFLYGVATGGGTTGAGTIFKIKSNGTSYENVYNFSSAINGYAPTGALVLSGNYLYGVGQYGGFMNAGFVFRFPLE